MPTFFHHQLANGLDIVAEPNADAHSFAVGLFVNTGARDEDVAINGVSHFLEHMMFKGSSRYTWEDVNRIFDEIGARYNAFTSQEMTAYYANVLPEFTEQSVEHLSHLLRPAIRGEDFETEKKVILEEIAMYLDEPSHRVSEAAMEAHFGNHPMSFSVLGTVQTIQAMKRDEMADYFRKRYGPGNMVLAASGKFDSAELVRMAEQYCGGWDPVDAGRRQARPTFKPRRKSMLDPKLSRQYTMGIAPAPSAQDERRFAARVLGDVIGDAEGSRFYWSLVDNAVTEEADFGYEPHDGCGSFSLFLVNEPDRTQKAIDIAMEEMRRVKEDLDDAEVERAKNKIASGLVLQGELPMGRMRSIAGQWLYNREYRSLEQDMATLEGVTTESLRELMTDFPFEPLTLVTLGPAEVA